VFTFDYQHDVPNHVIAEFDTGAGLDPFGNKSGVACGQLSLRITLRLVEVFRFRKGTIFVPIGSMGITFRR
jgi:predicted ThiF/HesA family dinucleotide-utilizing enzyme